MGNRRSVVFMAAASIVLAACAPISQLPSVAPDALRTETEIQRRLVVARHLADTERLHRIVYPILAANAPLCGAVARGHGLLAESRFDHASDFRSAADFAGLADEPSVIAVAPGSPAARAGIARGDRVLSVGGAVPDPVRGAREEVNALLAVGEGAAVSLTLERNGARHAVTLDREPVCDMPYRVVVSETINAYANGRALVVTTGLLRFFPEDADVAVVVGHEIAHNILGHVGTGAGNPGIAALFDFFTGGWGAKPSGGGERLPITQAYEAEADYVGLYLIARAGFPTAAAQNVYRRFAVSAPATIAAGSAASHPSSPARVVALGEAAREIEAKRETGAPLLPEKR